jgi:hypothetical protein
VIFSPRTIDDIRRYYRNCWVKFPGQGEALHYISDIEQRTIDGNATYVVTGCDVKGDEFVVQLWEDQPWDVSYVLPKKSLFTYNKEVYLLQRLPAKQYFRGINGENVSIHKLTKTFGWKAVNYTGELLQAYVDKQAFQSLTTRTVQSDIPFAVSSRFSFFPHSLSLYLDRNRIGYLTEPTLLKVHPLFYEDVCALVKDPLLKVETL